MVSMRLIPFLTVIFFFVTLIVPAAATEQARITDMFANGDVCEVTIGFSDDLHNVTLRYDLMLNDRSIDSKVVELGYVPTGNVTRIVFWDSYLEKNLYVFEVSVFVDGKLADSRQTEFIYGNQALLEFKVAGFNSDNKRAAVVISPNNIYSPSIVDLTFEIFEENELLYSATFMDVPVIQAMEKNIKWPVLLDNGRKYVTVLKVRSHGSDITSAYISIFMAEQDVEIMADDVELDEYGASITLKGMSQVPFYGKVGVTLSNNATNIYFEEESDVLTLNKEDTVGFLWEDIPPGNYTVEIRVINNEGKILDSYETAVRIRELPPVPPEQTKGLPGPGVIGNIAALLAVFFLLRINRR
ncbi:hypothetical protein [Methanomethylovorans hollandica]|nr:hypothetical protein [Methanomethylovorans hollandica]